MASDLSQDFLEHASFVWRVEGPTKQINLRRTISAAYYALFHLLVSEAAQKVSPSDEAIRARVSRSFQHGEMKEVCTWFRSPTPPEKLRLLLPGPLTPDLINIADTFIEAQQRRHVADYDPSTQFSRADVAPLITAVRRSFDSWQRIRGSHEGDVFLTALAFGRRWDR